MSMISEQIKEIEAVKHKYELQNINLLARVPTEYDIEVISGAISTIKELSEKLHAASMERSKVYYNGNSGRELLDRNDVCDVLEFAEDVSGTTYDEILNLPVIIGIPYQPKESENTCE